MSITMTHQQREDGINFMTLSGSMDVVSITQFNLDTRFAAAVAARHDPTIVDLSGVDLISSLGIGVLVGSAVSLKRRGTDMVLLGAQPAVRQALIHAGIHKVIPMVDRMDHAVATLRQPAAA